MERLNQFFKAVSDQTRLRIMILLYHQELYVCEISGILDLPQPKISKHLTKLRDLGLVKDSRREKFVSYSLNLKDDVMKTIMKSLACDTKHYPEIKTDIDRIKIRDKFTCCCSVPDLTDK